MRQKRSRMGVALLLLSMAASLPVRGFAQSDAGGFPGIGKFPDSVVLKRKTYSATDYTLITGPVKKKGYIEKGRELEARISRVVYRAPPNHTADEVMDHYEEKLKAAGFRVLFKCRTEVCGGISFYRAMETVPAMRVNPWDYRYLSAAIEGSDTDMFANVLVSAVRNRGPRRNGVYSVVNLIKPVPPERQSPPEDFFSRLPQSPPPAEKVETSVDEEPLGEEGSGDSMRLTEEGPLATEGAETPSPDEEEPAEEPAEEPSETPITAEQMAAYIAANGSVAVYGIHFDTNKAEITADSTETLEEIAALLGDNPDLKLVVVGHTDNMGSYYHNMTLSELRAKEVVKSLTTTYKVSPKRLRPAGVGFLAPIDSNQTEEGRARNRRVELVSY